MKLIKVVKSDKAGKKWKAVFDNDGRTKTTHFGAAGMDDYTLTGDVEARKRYRERHQKDLLTKDPTRAGYLSYEILWGPSTSIEANIRRYKAKYGL